MKGQLSNTFSPWHGDPRPPKNLDEEHMSAAHLGAFTGQSLMIIDISLVWNRQSVAWRSVASVGVKLARSQARAGPPPRQQKESSTCAHYSGCKKTETPFFGKYPGCPNSPVISSAYLRDSLERVERWTS